MSGKGRRGRGRGNPQGEVEDFPQLGGLQISNTDQEQFLKAPSWPRSGPSTSSAPSVSTTPRESQPPTPTPEPSPSSSETTTPAPSREASTPATAPSSDNPPPKPASSALAKVTFPARNGQGTRGTAMKVMCNHFEITIGKMNMVITEYDVAMKMIGDKDSTLKECPKKYFKPGLHAFGQKVWPNRHPAFDGSKLLFSCGRKLIKEPVTKDVKVRNDERFDDLGKAEPVKLRITVKEVNMVNLADIDRFMHNKETVPFPQLAVQAIDVILRNSGINSFQQVGRSFFFPPPNPKSLGSGIDLWHGVFQSAVLGNGKVFLNVDVAHKGFPRAQSVRDLVAELATNNQKFNQSSKFNPETDYKFGDKRLLDDQLQQYLKGLKVEYEIPTQANSKRVYRVNKVVSGPMNHKFTHEVNGKKKEMTVVDYFLKEKRYKIKHPNWPCLHVGNTDKNILVPMELCRVAPNQATIKKLNDDQTRTMIREAATKPSERRIKILDAFNSLELQKDPCLDEFKIKVKTQMMEVGGRVLMAPTLKYRADQRVTVRNGEWRIDNNKFQTITKEVRKWAILDLCGADKDIVNVKNQLVTIGSYVGMTFSDKPKIMKGGQRWNNLADLIRFLDNLVGEGPFDLMIVLIPDFLTGLSPYAVVKQVLELKHKILTQCIRQKTLRKFDRSTVSNILLKVNAKLDGKNHTIHKESRPPCFNQNVMIMGADVTHPPAESKSCPSVAAVTASHDREDMFKYNMQWRLQPPRVEEILDMESITLAHLKFFALKNAGKFPDRIIFYRDGVSDGQFEMVLRCELDAIKKAIRTVRQGYSPKITFLVVQKRHHTRFFPSQGDKSADRNGNVPAGFVVDNTITHPRDMDFYLVSHQSIQGTSRPTKYKVLYDDANMSEDEVEQLTYYLCHLYSRCNRSVSYPAPTYYAHLAAFRAKHYYNEGRSTIDIRNEKDLKLESIKLNEMMDPFIKNHPMFFV